VGGRWRAWLFDLDKTLVNVEDGVDYCAALRAVRAEFPDVHGERGLPPVDFGRCAVQVLAVLAALHEDPQAFCRASELVEHFELQGACRSVAMPGLEAVWLARGGRLTGVVTLLGPRAAWAVLRHHGLEPDCVVGREGGLRMKPAPDPVLRALQRLGVERDEAVLVGDSKWDEQAAQAAGVAFLGLTWGRRDPGFAAATPVARDLVEAARLLVRS
jgi:phosphoglycolate phosphatase-like HAD superfamily hydrolase